MRCDQRARIIALSRCILRAHENPAFAEAPMGQRRLLVLAILFLIPALAHAQEATVIGTVTDSTGGVLPGATVRAVHDATGNTFETGTDERGNFRIPPPTGPYRFTAELQAFSPPT